VADALAVIVWVAAPPSDHERNVYRVPPSDCVAGALSETEDLAMTVRVNGVVPAARLTTKERPLGLDRMLRSTVLGSRRRLLTSCRPAESVAVSCSSMYDG
jgi:hypothetical protein